MKIVSTELVLYGMTRMRTSAVLIRMKSSSAFFVHILHYSIQFKTLFSSSINVELSETFAYKTILFRVRLSSTTCRATFQRQKEKIFWCFFSVRRKELHDERKALWWTCFTFSCWRTLKRRNSINFSGFGVCRLGKHSHTVHEDNLVHFFLPFLWRPKWWIKWIVYFLVVIFTLSFATRTSDE